MFYCGEILTTLVTLKVMMIWIIWLDLTSNEGLLQTMIQTFNPPCRNTLPILLVIGKYQYCWFPNIGVICDNLEIFFHRWFISYDLNKWCLCSIFCSLWVCRIILYIILLKNCSGPILYEEQIQLQPAKIENNIMC